MTEKIYYNQLKKEWGNVPTPYIISGKSWYWDYRDYTDKLAKENNLQLSQTCGIFSALSPLKSVEENKKLCENVIIKRKYRGHTKRQLNKVKCIIVEKEVEKIDLILNGLKTVNFFRNIYSPWDKNYVTVDRHMIKLCHKGKEVLITPKRYKLMANAIKKLANEVNLYPSECQSVLWFQAKSLYGNNI